MCSEILRKGTRMEANWGMVVSWRSVVRKECWLPKDMEEIGAGRIIDRVHGVLLRRGRNSRKVGGDQLLP